MEKPAYTFEKLTKERAMWYGAPCECYIVRFWPRYAPKEKFALLDEKGRYTDNPAKGYFQGNGNLGTGSMLLVDVSILENQD